MSVEHMAAVLHHSKAKGTAKLVLLGIANHAGDGGAWPSVATLARYANTTERSTQRAIAKLVELGELRTTVQAGGLADMDDHLRPNRYDVLCGCPAYCDRSPQHRDTRTTADRQLGLWKTNPDLGIKGVTPVSPGDASVTGGGDASVTLTTITNPVATVPRPVTDRAREAPAEAGPICDVCSRTPSECAARSRTSGHTYTPRKATA